MAAKSTRSASAIDAKLVRDLAKILNDTDLTEIEVEKGDLKLRVARQGVAATMVATPAPAQTPAPQAVPAPTAPAPTASEPDTPDVEHPGTVKSPMVGTAYIRPNPDSAPFVKIGDKVSEGDTILLIEAMKTFNPITAEKSGTLIKTFVSDGQAVEFGEPLFVIE